LSTLGKILTVLVALVSVAVAVLVAREFVLGNNWRYLYEEAGKNAQLALADRDDALGQRNLEKAARDADRAKAQQQIETLTSELNVRNGTIATLTNEKESMGKQLAELTAQVTGIKTNLDALIREKDAWRKERDDASKKADDLTTMYAELEAKYRNAAADVQNLKESLRTTREEKAALESRIAYILQNHPDVKLPAQVPAVPTARIQGLVTKADNEAHIAEINLGTDDGVVKGMRFIVYSPAEMKYVATLTINMVSTNSAAGELSVIRGTVKANDNVTNRFE
jgi:regulator of replication initiation timing